MISAFVESHPPSQVYVARAPSPATAIIVKAVLRDKG